MADQDRPAASVSVRSDLELIEVVVSRGLDRYETVGLIALLTKALAELWPEPDPSWRSDPNREDDSGRIGKTRRARRKRESR